jgi:RimJ/RimL family protein N-acetyltransferase
MTWHLADRADDFAAHAGAFLQSRPVANTVPLTLVANLRARGPFTYGPEQPVFGWWTDGGEVTGAFLQTPPHPPILTAMPAAAVPALADALADRRLPGVNTPDAYAETFAAAWQRRTGASARIGRRTRLYRLGELTPPEPPAPGRARVAEARDRELLIDWYIAFHADIGEEFRQGPSLVDDKLEYGGLTLWEDGGVPVAMAGISRPEAGMVRVAAVYTPPEVRGRGYGGAVTAAVTRSALDAGAAHVVLFTDLANPTSNALYQRLGFRPVEDRTVVEFTA